MTSGSTASWSVSVGIAALLLAVVGPLTHTGADQQASRLSFTSAIWDHQTAELTRYEELLHRDRSVRGDAVYSDKAPLQPFLAVPAYGIYRLAGGEATENLKGPFGWFNWGLWWVTLVSAAIPGGVLAALMHSWARDADATTGLWAALALALGTMLLIYSSLLFGHVLAALFAFGSFLLIRKKGGRRSHLVMGGVLLGAAVVVEYPVVLIAGVLAAAASVRHRSRAGWVLVGGAPWAFGLAVYNWALFGSPTSLSYHWSAFNSVRGAPLSTLDIFSTPSLERLIEVLFSSRGLLFATPIVAVALLGVGLMWRSQRFDAAVVIAVFLAMLMVQVSWANSFAGGAGPRYVTPALPFLAAPLAFAWRKWNWAALGYALLSTLGMLAALLTNPQLPSDLDVGTGFWLWLFSNGHLTSSVFTRLIGQDGWMFHGLLVVVAIAALALAVRRESQDPSMSSGTLST